MSTAQQGCALTTEGYVVSGLVLRFFLMLIQSRYLSYCHVAAPWHDDAIPSSVRKHAHLTQYAAQFHEFDESAHTMVLLGRDCGEVMAAQLLTEHEPYLYSTPLSSALVGSVCLFV